MNLTLVLLVGHQEFETEHIWKTSDRTVVEKLAFVVKKQKLLSSEWLSVWQNCILVGSTVGEIWLRLFLLI